MRRLSSFATLLLVACSAPPAEQACNDYCDQVIYACGAQVSEARCMWVCLAGMEWRKQKGRRCHKKHRREIACLANVTDCEFLLEETSYRRGDPCAERGNARTASCNEDGLSADELLPLSFDPDAEWPWSEGEVDDADESDGETAGDDDTDDTDDTDDADSGVLRGDIYRL